MCFPVSRISTPVGRTSGLCTLTLRETPTRRNGSQRRCCCDKPLRRKVRDCQTSQTTPSERRGGGSSETGALERLNEKTGLVSLSREFQTAIGMAGMQDIGACFRGIRKTSRRWLLPHLTPLAAPTEFFGGSGIRSKLDL